MTDTADTAGTAASTLGSPETAKTPQSVHNNNNNTSAIEFEPPLACVRRILKTALPNSTNVGKDASAAFCRASGIFVIYLTACANDFARENKRQTITANDVLAAVKVSTRRHTRYAQRILVIVVTGNHSVTCLSLSLTRILHPTT
jgi:histone H3/H4